MKKVIFVCLVTISVCLGLPAGETGGKPAPPSLAPTNHTDAVPKLPPTDAKPEPPTKQNETSVTHQNDTVPIGGGKASNTSETSPKNESTPTAGNETTPTAGNETTPTAGNETTPTAGNETSNKNASSNVPPADKPVNPPTKANTTTTTTTTTTQKPTATVPTLQARGFDGASFVGGIILTLGLLAIGFMGFRYYKTQTERNYHTL